MPISFQCVKCHARMTVPDNLAGKRGKCKNCQTPLVVPSQAAQPQPVKAGGPAPPPPPLPQKPPVESVEDIESAALEALADPKEEVKEPQQVEFECPQCSELVKLPADLAGKRHPCPHCTRIIPVPMPAKRDPTNWRDTGPKKPEGAKREEVAAPEGAWGAGNASGLSEETMEEAGLIKEKDRPLTFYQRFETPILIGVPTILLLVAGWFFWGWWASGTEQAAFDSAMKFIAEEKGKDAGALAAFKVKAADYVLRRQADDKTAETADRYMKEAIGHAKRLGGEGRDALLLDNLDGFSRLGGERDESGRGHRLTWDDTQVRTRKCLEEIGGREARLLALRKVAAGLARAGQGQRAIALVGQISSGSSQGRRVEALAVVGLELFAAGEKDLAGRAANQALAPYTSKDKAKVPDLRGPVVALAIATGKPPPKPGKDIEEEEEDMYGHIEGLVLSAKAAEARQPWPREVPKEARARAAALLASVTGEKEDIDAALRQVVGDAQQAGKLDWALLRLVGAATKAGGDQAEKFAGLIQSPVLREWARLAVLRQKLKGSRSVVGEEALEGLAATTAPGLLARLELARHNVAIDGGWTAKLKEWDEAPAAFGWLGAALAMRGEE